MSSKKAKYCDNCCVVGCHNNNVNSPGTHFYCFPRANFLHPYKKERRDKWIAAVRRQNSDGSMWVPTERSRICSRHFVGNEKSENPQSPSYHPSIFPSVYKKQTVSTQSASDRFKRAMKRRITHTGESSSSTNTRNSTLGQDCQDGNIEVSGNQVEAILQPEVVDDNTDKVSSKIDQGTQVYFMDENIPDNNCCYLTCNQYVYIDASTKEPLTADVALQVYIPDAANNVKINLKKPKTSDKCIGTNVTFEDKAVGLEAYDRNTEGDLRCTTGFHGRASIENDEQMLDLGGVTIHTFNLLTRILPTFKEVKISNENRLLIFLFKLKCGLTYSALSVLFGVHRKTITTIFLVTLQYLAGACKKFVFWPSREAVQATMPPIFRETYKNCRVIIDCTEFRAEQPSDVQSRVEFYSHYKKTFTVKILVGCTPSGVISFVSRCYGGRTTDAQITSGSGFLDLLEPNDLILADKGFPQIKTQLDENGRGIILVMPPFLYNDTFTAEEVKETYKVASVRIHIERIMQRLRIYRILDKFTTNMLAHSDNIVFMCCVLVNLQPSIIRNSDEE